MTNAKPFIDLLRLATKSGFPTVVLNNRMLMQCYDIAQDSDIGFHYILHIPDGEDYDDKLYDSRLVLKPKEILSVYKEGHDALLAEKKRTGAKPKEVQEELVFFRDGPDAVIRFIHYVKDEIVAKGSWKTPYHIDPTNQAVANIEGTYQTMIERIKVGGQCVIVNGLKNGLMDIGLSANEINFYTIKVGGKKVKVPLYKSMFLGQSANNAPAFYISVQETELDRIYLYTIQFQRKGIVEQFIGYIQNF